MKKRLIALLLALVFIAAMFAGCAKDGVEPTEAASNTETPAQTGAPEVTDEADPYSIELPLTDTHTEITLWATINPQVAQIVGEGGLGETSIFKYFEEISNVQINSTSVPGNAAADVFAIFIASDDYTDLIGSMGQLYTGGFDGAIENEIIIDLTDLVAEYMPNYSDALYSNETYVKALTTDEGHMGVFAMLYDRENIRDQGPMIRKD